MKELIVITGASSGIGLATARAFQEKGHPLLLLARRVDRLKVFEDKQALCVKVDVTDIKGFKHAVSEAEKKFGPIGCLVNNAGVMLLGLIQDQNPAEWKQMYDVNVLGVLNGIKVIVNHQVGFQWRIIAKEKVRCSQYTNRYLLCTGKK